LVGAYGPNESADILHTALSAAYTASLKSIIVAHTSQEEFV